MFDRRHMFVLLGGLVITVAAAVSYAPAVQGDFIWDDDKYVVENNTLDDLDGLRRIWTRPRASRQYYPMVFTTFWLERRIQGGDQPDPALFHVTNIALHIICALLLWLILARLRVPGAWLAAAIFALHPVHVESVAWITERKNVLSLTFYLLSLLCYLRFSGLDRDAAPSDGAPNDTLPAPPHLTWPWYAVALVCFVAALLSKSVTCSLPAAIVLLLWWKRPKWLWRDLIWLAPWFAIGLVLAVNTARLEHGHVGTRFIDFGLAWDDRIVLAGQIAWFYFYKLLWPAELIFFYECWRVSAAEPAQWLFVLATIGVVFALWKLRRRIGKGPLVSVLFFGGTLVPALGFIDVWPMIFSWVADHFQYHASIGVIALFAACATLAGRAIWRRWAPPSLADRPIAQKLAAAVPVAALLLTLSTLTWRQSHVYRDLETLWTTTIDRNPRCTMAYVNLGQLRAAEGRVSEANEFYRAVTNLDPPEPVGFLRAMAHYNLGQNLRGAGQYREAVTEYTHAVRAYDLYVSAWYGRGVAHERLGRYADAASDFRRVLQLNANHTAARQALARVQARVR